MSPFPFFTAVGWALALLCGCWGWCGGELAPGAGRLLRLYRSIFFGISVFFVDLWCAALDPPAGRGGLGWSVSVSALCFLLRLALSLSGRPWWRGEEVRSRRGSGGRLRQAVLELSAGIDGRGVVAGGRHGRARSSSFDSVACGGRILRLLHEWDASVLGCAAAWRLLLRRCSRSEERRVGKECLL